MQGKPAQSDVDQASARGADRAWLRRLPFLAILSTAVLGAVLLRDQLDFDALARHQADLLGYRDAHYLVTVLGFILIYVAIVGLSLPGATVATLAGGYLFGVFPGVLYNVGSAGTGAILVFLAARAGFGRALSDRMAKGGGAVTRLRSGLVRNEWSVLFLMRLLPVIPFFLANLLPAAIGTSLWRFAVTTFLGIFPATLVFTAVGAGLGEVFARGERPDFGLLLEPQIMIPILGLALIAALPMVLKAVRKEA
jgi:uncharacterized membrane protein YdjX (TVP38/TMEM64 family)